LALVANVLRQGETLKGFDFTTFRYHLVQGLARIIDWLWQREPGGADG
jgi:hypothetical protein